MKATTEINDRKKGRTTKTTKTNKERNKPTKKQNK